MLRVLLRAIRTTLRRARPPAPGDAWLGAVSFLHCFGSALNPHFHFHIVVLDEHTVEGMLTWQASGGFSLDASVRIHGSDSAGRERLLRYCARPPFALERYGPQRAGVRADG